MEENNKNEPFNIYCNSIEVATSPFDFTLSLHNNSPKGMLFLGEIKMSPEHAKVFAKILSENVNNFENLFGAIPQLNEEKMKQFQSQGKIIIKDSRK